MGFHGVRWPNAWNLDKQHPPFVCLFVCFGKKHPTIQIDNLNIISFTFDFLSPNSCVYFNIVLKLSYDSSQEIHSQINNK